MKLFRFRLRWQLLDPNQSYSYVPMQSMETLEVTPLHIETLNGSLASVVPGVGLIIELTPERRAAVLAQTSVKLFQLAGVQPQ